MKSTLLAIALSTAALSAQAADLDYNTVQATYNKVDAGAGNLDGFGVNGSFKFNDSLYGIAGYQKLDGSGGDLDETNLGLGFRKAINDKADWVSELSYVRDSADAGSFGSVSGNGYRVATGIRGLATDKLELSGKINYTDVNNFGNGMGAGVAATYKLTENFGLTAGYDFSKRDSEDLNGWNAGVRFNF